MLSQEIRRKIFQKSKSLEKYGLSDLTCDKEDAKGLIHAIMQEHIGILGGDVYKLQSDCLEPLSDNWSCEPTDMESEEEFYKRSKTQSLNYIENYPMKSGEKIIFSVTFTERLS